MAILLLFEGCIVCVYRQKVLPLAHNGCDDDDVVLRRNARIWHRIEQLQRNFIEIRNTFAQQRDGIDLKKYI